MIAYPFNTGPLPIHADLLLGGAKRMHVALNFPSLLLLCLANFKGSLLARTRWDVSAKGMPLIAFRRHMPVSFISV